MTSPQHLAPVARTDQSVERATWVPTLGPGMILGAIATVGIFIAMFMSWRTGDVHPSGIPFAFLFDHSTTAQDPSILLALIPMTILLAVGSAMPQARVACVVGSLGIIAVATLFAVQLNQQLDAIPGANVGDVLDTGFYVAAIAGLVGLVSGFMPSGWTQRRAVQTESAVNDGRDVYAEPRV